MALLGAARHRPAWIESAHNAALLTWPLITLAAGLLIVLLVTDQYQINYVHSVTSRAMPFISRSRRCGAGNRAACCGGAG